MTAPSTDRSERRATVLVAVVGPIAVVTVAVGLRLRLHDGKLGTVSAPFVSGWLPAIDPVGAIVAVLACFAVVLAGRFLVDAPLHPAAVAAALFALTLGAGLALNVARQGTSGWTEIFDLLGGTSQSHAINEYLPGLPTLKDGVRNYLDRFAEVVPSQSVNIAGHPPGPLLLAHAVGADTAGGLARLVILIGSLCAPLTYRLAWTLSGDERTGRVAGLLCVASPLTLLFGVTSFDYAFAAFATLAACGLVARSWRWQAVGLVALAWASLMSWALLAVGAWAAIVVLQRDGLRRAVILAALCGLAVGALQGFLAAAYGYDPIGTLRATEQVYRDSLATVRPYWFWVFGSPVAWGLMLGPLIVAAVLRGAAAGSHAAIAITAVVMIAAIGGFSKAETERIWLFMVPLACAAAAPHLGRLWVARRGASAQRQDGPGRDGAGCVAAGPLTVVLALLLLQAFVFQLLMNTVW